MHSSRLTFIVLFATASLACGRSQRVIEEPPIGSSRLSGYPEETSSAPVTEEAPAVHTGPAHEGIGLPGPLREHEPEEPEEEEAGATDTGEGEQTSPPVPDLSGFDRGPAPGEPGGPDATEAPAE